MYGSWKGGVVYSVYVTRDWRPNIPASSRWHRALPSTLSTALHTSRRARARANWPRAQVLVNKREARGNMLSNCEKTEQCLFVVSCSRVRNLPPRTPRWGSAGVLVGVQLDEQGIQPIEKPQSTYRALTSSGQRVIPTCSHPASASCDHRALCDVC